jgi:hypothetical protein
MAAEMAGFESDTEYEILEIPKSKGFINFSRRSLGFPFSVENDSAFRYLEMLSRYPGQPLPMLIPGTYPELE